MSHPLSPHLQNLESEAIHVIREVATSFQKPVFLYSIGKDSTVLLHLMCKAFASNRPPFPLMHIDTLWKFKDMISFRDDMVARLGVELITYTNPEGAQHNIVPYGISQAAHTQVMKAEALRQALDMHGFDAALDGARRDEEKSRAKERIFSIRGQGHVWEPRLQRPEFWNLYK